MLRCGHRSYGFRSGYYNWIHEGDVHERLHDGEFSPSIRVSTVAAPPPPNDALVRLANL